MELTTLRYFRAIAHAGHMTRAAQALGVSQPALSAMLKKLEAHVGAELLHRTARGVTLTEAGRLFLSHAEDALRHADAGLAAVRELAGLQRGSIRLGGGATAITYLLPSVISAFRKHHPALHFYLREAASSHVAAAVLSSELDLGLVTLPVHVPGAADLLNVLTIADELLLILPPGHRLTGRKSFKWADLAGESMVGFEAGSAVRDLIDAASAAQGITLQAVMELRSIESIRSMVAAGVGIGFVSRYALPASVGLSCRDGKLARTLALIRRRDRVPSPASAAFERTLIAALSAAPR